MADNVAKIATLGNVFLNYNKYNANRTRNVAYYMTTGLCLVRAIHKKNSSTKKRQRFYVSPMQHS